MMLVIKELLTSWDGEKNQRIKLQRAYFVTTLVLAVAAGLVTLLNPLLGTNILIIAAFIAAVYVVNAIGWTIVDLIISKKISNLVKSTPAKKR